MVKLVEKRLEIIQEIENKQTDLQTKKKTGFIGP